MVVPSRLGSHATSRSTAVMQATTMDDDGVMSGELLGQAAGDIANNQWLPGLPDDVKR